VNSCGLCVLSNELGLSPGVSDPQQCIEIKSGGIQPWTLITFMYCKVLSHYKIVMDQSWINLSRISDDYERGVKEFIEFAQHHGGSANVKERCGVLVSIV